MNGEPIIVIERPNAASRNTAVPVLGRAGPLGVATWDDRRGCHCLRLPLSRFTPERRAIVERLCRRDQVAFDFEPGEAASPEGEPAPTELEMILVDYQLEDETAEQALLRMISHLTTLQAWTPQKGKKPELEVPKPCSPSSS